MALFQETVDVFLVGIESARLKTFLEGFENQVCPASLDLLDRWDFFAFDDLARVTLYALQAVNFTAEDEGYSTT